VAAEDLNLRPILHQVQVQELLKQVVLAVEKVGVIHQQQVLEQETLLLQLLLKEVMEVKVILLTTL
jgi:hypothetical protein